MNLFIYLRMNETYLTLSIYYFALYYYQLTIIYFAPMSWTSEEILNIRQYVNQCGSKFNQNECSKAVGSRTPRQCYDYFHLQMTAERVKETNHKWTEEDNELLLQFDSKSMSWKQFQQAQFSNLTLSQLKNQFQQLRKKKQINNQ